ncbi:MAG TPA: ABC transporter permease [Vicinamibacterales bacterium]|nr:ABC transporter permease [Vicinamibacterales bacterium]
MAFLRSIAHKLLGLFGRSRSETALADEINGHLDAHITDNMRAGMTREEAERRARLALYGAERTKETYRDLRGFPVVDALLQDVRHGIRTLTQAPGFSLAAILILALGIGANSAIFSVVDAVLLRPLPFANPERIMRVWHTPPPEQFGGRRIFAVSAANYLDWQAQNHVFDYMSLVSGRALTMTGSGAPEVVPAGVVDADFFNVLGMHAIAGRTFVRNDTDPSAPRTVILDEGLWRSRFAGDPGVVGQTVSFSGERRTVIGVVKNVNFMEATRAWTPISWTPQQRAVRGNHNFSAIARLKPGVDVRQAQAELTTISDRLARQYPADDKGWGALVLPLHDDLVGNVRTPLFVLFGAVAFVLLIACANLANLFLAKGLARGRELAVRAALGASRARIAQQLLVETTLLALAGAAVGLVVARAAVAGLVSAVAQSLPRAGEIVIDSRALAFTAAIAMVTGIVAGMVPAWRLTMNGLNDTLKQGMGRGGSESGERRVRHFLVASEVAVAMLLLVGAGLLIRSLGELRAVEPGIDRHNVLTMLVATPRAKYPEALQQLAFFNRVLDRVQALPGVESAATIDNLPLEGGSMQPVAVEGQPAPPLAEQPEVGVRHIVGGYVSTVRMRLIAGRDLTRRDELNQPPTVLVSESMARRFWPNGNPIGRHLTLGLMSNESREVVGIVSDVKLAGLDSSDSPAAVYVPQSVAPQQGGGVRRVVIRTTVPPTSVTNAVTAVVRDIDPEQPVLFVRTMDEVIGQSLAQQRFAMWLLTLFAGLALLLAAAGIYSVLSYTVRTRVREIGIRLALGATSHNVLRQIVVEGMVPALAGLAIGLIAAGALSRLLTTLVFGITPHDAVTFAAGAAVIVLVALLASVIPGHRATRIDPLQALRTE